MTIQDVARHKTAQVYRELGLEYRHGAPEIVQIEALFRMCIRDAIRPYEDVSAAAAEFLRRGEFYIPGGEAAVKRLNRLREAVFQYEQAQRQNREEA